MVDLAGTGRSAPVDCRMYPTARELVGDFYPIPLVRACRDSLARAVDLSRYVTATLVVECGANFSAAFLARASADGVDFSCKDRVQLPPFLPSPR